MSFGLNAQYLIETSTSQPTAGTNINVPINVENLPTVYTLTIYLEYDNTVLTYTGETNLYPGLTISVETEGDIKYFADVPEGARVQITIADRDAILNGCRESLEMAIQRYPEGKSPEAAVFFSCSARKLLLGTKTSEEYQILKEKIDPIVPMCGFYGYGEIGPIEGSSASAKFHNETFISLLLGT